MKYVVKKEGIGIDCVNVKICDTNKKDIAINQAKECFEKFDFEDLLFYKVNIYENDKKIMTICY